MDVIPVDDIGLFYAELSNEQKSAVTNLIQAGAYILVTAHDPEGKRVIMDWHAAQPMSMHLILGILGTGRNEFGRLWLEELKNKLSQMA